MSQYHGSVVIWAFNTKEINDISNLFYMFSPLFMPLCHCIRRSGKNIPLKLKEAAKTPWAFPKEEETDGKKHKKQGSQGALVAAKRHRNVWKVTKWYIKQKVGWLNALDYQPPSMWAKLVLYSGQASTFGNSLIVHTSQFKNLGSNSLRAGTLSPGGPFAVPRPLEWPKLFHTCQVCLPPARLQSVQGTGRKHYKHCHRKNVAITSFNNSTCFANWKGDAEQVELCHHYLHQV